MSNNDRGALVHAHNEADPPRPAALYIHSARRNQAGEQKQLEACQEYASKLGLDVVQVFADLGISGLSTDRVGLNGLLAACASGVISHVVTEDCSRLSRSFATTVSICQTLAEHNVELHEVENEKVDLAAFAPQALTAHEYRRQLQTRLMAGRVKAAEDGRVSHRVRFGYALDRVADKKGCRLVHEERAKVVRGIFHAFGDENRSLTQIAQVLSGQVPPPADVSRIDHGRAAATRSRWTPAMLRQILRCPMYAGWLVEGRARRISDREMTKVVKIVPVPEDEQRCVEVPKWRIVDPDLWSRCQRRLSKRSRTAKTPDPESSTEP